MEKNHKLSLHPQFYSHFLHIICKRLSKMRPFKTKKELLNVKYLNVVYNHPQKLWHKAPSPSSNVDFLSFRPTRCTRQPSEQFQTIFTLSQHWSRRMILRKKGVAPQYFVTDCRFPNLSLDNNLAEVMQQVKG